MPFAIKRATIKLIAIYIRSFKLRLFKNKKLKVKAKLKNI
jgi:hypothetical protein